LKFIDSNVENEYFGRFKQGEIFIWLIWPLYFYFLLFHLSLFSLLKNQCRLTF